LNILKSMPLEAPPRSLEVLVLLQSGQPIGQRAVDWAVSALEAGFDCHSIRLLAGLDMSGQPTSFEAIPLFDAALLELGIQKPSFDEAARLYVREIADATLAGRLAPRHAADLIHRRVIGPLDHPEDLMPWCYVWEGNSADCTRSLEDHEWDNEIMKVAREFASDAD
jgi:hypothetical protein